MIKWAFRQGVSYTRLTKMDDSTNSGNKPDHRDPQWRRARSRKAGLAAAAKLGKDGCHSRAIKAAEARWGKKDPSSPEA